MARVLVTRALPDAAATATRLVAMGHEAILSPVLQIESIPYKDDGGGAQAVLFTSAAAARAVTANTALKLLPALAVGDATAEAARHAGFAQTISAGGVGADLIATARARLDPARGAILHLRGEDIASDIAGALRDAGFEARDAIVYRAAFADALLTEALTCLTAAPPRIDSALFHSARGAEAFARLVRAAGIAHVTSALTALCLSDRVAETAKALVWREIRVAPAPREEALLSLL